METKKFFDAFPNLKLNSELTELFEKVIITQIIASRKKSSIRIWIQCGYIIDIKKLKEMADEISRQYFKNTIAVEFVERYFLSSQYTPEFIFKEYYESIMERMLDDGALTQKMFKASKISFSENEMHIKIEDNITTTQKSKFIQNVLESMYRDVFGIEVKVNIEVTESKRDKYKEQNAAILKAKTEAIMERVLTAQSEKENITTENEVAATAENTNSSIAKKSYARRMANPDVIFGRDFEEEAIPIVEVDRQLGEVVIRGQVLNLASRPIKNEKTIVSITITDHTDTIIVKMFLKNEFLETVLPEVDKGKFLMIKGVASLDTYDHMIEVSSVTGIKKIPSFFSKRHDDALEKRVELHCHTKMSEMDSICDTAELVKRAYEWGHRAVAITDHGVVQAFPDARHAYEDIVAKCKKEGKDPDFKVIYGCEAYLVDDLKDMVINCKGQTLKDTYVVFDIETTGFSPISDTIIEIGAVKVDNGKIIDKYSVFVNPKRPIPYRIVQLTGITDEMVMGADDLEHILPEFIKFCEGAVMVAHNAEFDMSFIRENSKRQGIVFEPTVVDTVTMSRALIEGLNKYTLDSIAKTLNVSLESHHRAVDDAGCTAEIFLKLSKMLQDKDIDTLDKANEYGKNSNSATKKMPDYHAIILAKNEIGRVNLYRLVSIAHLENFSRRPRILKSNYNKYKEGLIIGSACEAGELYQAILRGHSDQEIARLAEFYDYYEIQPIMNNAFMLRNKEEEIEQSEAQSAKKGRRKKEHFKVDSVEDLKEINRKIVALGEKFNKPVVATCDVHFMDPEDEIYRRIIQYGNGFDDADKQPPLYFRTTEEMLEEFEYLGGDKAKEVVIKNTNMIADMIENFSPIHPDKCPPVIENSDITLRQICYEKAHEMYGDPLPEIVKERLERELNSIISNGFAVMYIMAQKLVWKSNADGYLVGSRGSVGSSFVATMAGITEVNPLRPHYYCKNCKYSDFESDVVKAQIGGCGYDLPDAICPDCGEPLIKAGFDIPFETFLGFNGDKEPDIDLNFSGEYQSNAHDYTEVMFGKGHTFRAGTIATLADKTAFGYVMKYFEEHGENKRMCEIDRIKDKCTGIRRSSGQHPGGIVIVPRDKEIYEFTPVQHPANDMTTQTITTHFDYHAIDKNLLKLDILGHDDPTMIRRLEKLTNTDAMEIPFDDKKVMSLFLNTEALGITPEDIGGCKLGSLGIPEFGTEFVIQMLLDTKPQKFADLVRISGLSHGTDVWLGNAQKLIKEGKATISTAICTRDDIMTYLINMGMDPGLSFNIMEIVRKGKKLIPDEWEQAMKEAGVPDWYIWSCNTIKYMFPKAHAAAYVMMAFRIAYYKVYYPLAYYAAFFGIRAKAFDYELMCQGRARVDAAIEDYQMRKAVKKLSSKEESQLVDLKIVQEMYARGFEFHKLDLFEADAHNFKIIDGKIMPAIDSIDGLGDKAADAVVEGAKKGPFLSREEFRNRCKVSKTVTENMKKLGILADLPESAQLSIFDFQED
ncbi:MAG: PolC-type DNA polymerase III [Eubacterium sp.]